MIVVMLGASLLSRLSFAFARSRPGRVWFGHIAATDPDLLLSPLGYTLASNATLQASWPETLERFENVAPVVLSSNPANRGAASMTIAELAHLWRLAASSPSQTLVEIGRERGGSTLAIAAAMARDATLWSFDPQTKHEAGETFDRELMAVLDRYGLRHQVRLVLADSRTAPLPPDGYGLVLVDGDPAAARSDHERFARRLVPGGHVLFHDAIGGVRERELAPLLRDLDADPTFVRRPGAGTFADYQRV